ncbi:MAG: pitrilysin family protein [Novosphingobium sp.]|uniref:M16 family metallopeptidase n=1 Tax=Novosphingobium sp. TaxID=1874826 RepID=UPI0032B9E997
MMIRIGFLTGAAVVALSLAMPGIMQFRADAAAAAHAPALKAPPIAFTEWRLPNGLKVIAIPDKSTANVMVSVWYAVGSKHDPEGRSGFAHLFEHILSRKTENMPYNMINRLTEDVGGVRNASTSDDRTNYYEIVPAQYLETLLWTHAERMARPVVDAEVFERERSIVKEEYRQRIMAPSYGRMRLALVENGFDLLPQRRSTIGSIAQLDAAKLDDARAFHQAFYGPDTATMIVSGNFDPAQLKQYVQRMFGAIPARAKPVPLEIATLEPPRTAPRRVDMTAPNVPLPVVAFQWKLPGALSSDRPALEVLDAILGRGDNSRFNQVLVRSGKAVSASPQFNFSREGGSAVLLAVIGQGQSQDEVAGLLDGEVKKVRAVPVTSAELAEAKNELISDSLRARETAQGRAFELGEELAITGDPRAADRRLAALARVTAADVLRVAKAYFSPQTRLELRYGAGVDNPASYANPFKMPVFGSVDPATGSPRVLRDEASRQAPPAPGAKPAIRAPQMTQSKLSNGIAVVSARTGLIPVATFTVLFPGGSSTDPQGLAGLANMVAGLAGEGTPSRSAEQIAARFESLGAELSTSVTADGTLLSVSAPTANLAPAAEVLADMIQNANYPEASFERERKRALDGLQASYKDPGALGAMALQPLLYGSAPYGMQGQGTIASLGRLTRADLAAQRQQQWSPHSVKILVSGGIDPAAGTALAERLFGKWNAAPPPPAMRVSRAGPAPAPRTVVIDLPGAGQAAVYVATRGVGRSEPDFYALQLANSVLGAGSNGRLFEEVRTKRGLSYGAYSSFASRAEAGLLIASAQTKNESAAEVVKVMLDQFTRLGTEPISADALQKRRLFLTGGTQRALETSSGFSGVIGGLILQGLLPSEAFLFADRLAGVSPAAVNAAAAHYVLPGSATVLIVGDASAFIDALRAVRGDVVVIKASDLNLDSPTLRNQ